MSVPIYSRASINFLPSNDDVAVHISHTSTGTWIFIRTPTFNVFLPPLPWGSIHTGLTLGYSRPSSSVVTYRLHPDIPD
ncbi:Protein of unknown function [Pyronema omphalodes CBS 100304]|uniref:Uncharacterized protein n=1 Tax=Pyronema omphalodes (strain CBS 100304) TaxID=1076935 RepID=U4LQJ0_PYROM|nr:Protein of unknown function [Pyronema omphalodes CBS 100304]